MWDPWKFLLQRGRSSETQGWRWQRLNWTFMKNILDQQHELCWDEKCWRNVVWKRWQLLHTYFQWWKWKETNVWMWWHFLLCDLPLQGCWWELGISSYTIYSVEMNGIGSVSVFLYHFPTLSVCVYSKSGATVTKCWPDYKTHWTLSAVARRRCWQMYLIMWTSHWPRCVSCLWIWVVVFSGIIHEEWLYI